MITRQNSKSAKIKSVVIALGIVGMSFGLYRYMSKFPEPGRTGLPVPTEYEVEERLVAERVEQDVLWLCEDIGRRSSRFSVRAIQLRESLEHAIVEAGFSLETQEYKVVRKPWRLRSWSLRQASRP